MNCPYCNNEMIKGIIEADGRAPLRWLEDGEEVGLMERIFDPTHHVIAKAHPLSKTILESYRCRTCNKIIIDI